MSLSPKTSCLCHFKLLKAAVPPPPGIAKAPGASYFIPDKNIPIAPPITRPETKLENSVFYTGIPPPPAMMVLNALGVREELKRTGRGTMNVERLEPEVFAWQLVGLACSVVEDSGNLSRLGEAGRMTW